jgi:TonB family protein
MMFDVRHLRGSLKGFSLGMLLLSLTVCASLLSAQEAPRTQSLSPIKPPMIKPPMHNTKNANTGGSKRRRTTRRRARRGSVKARIPRQASAKPTMVGGASPSMSSAASIKPPMANEGNAALATPKPVSGGVLNGKAITLPKPTYPTIARSARASGTVVVEVVIDERGDVIEARAVSGNEMLRASAVEAAREAKFTPTLLAGQPVKVTGMITYDFVP